MHLDWISAPTHFCAAHRIQFAGRFEVHIGFRIRSLSFFFRAIHELSQLFTSYTDGVINSGTILTHSSTISAAALFFSLLKQPLLQMQVVYCMQLVD
jgi:hypothetical protein